MIPKKSVRLALGELLAADVDTFAPVAANKIALIASNFTPEENLDLGTLTLASFTGSTPLAGASGAQEAGIDPLTGDQKITNLAPAGGWRWECTAAPVAPETIYGYIIINSAGDDWVAVALFDTPYSIAEVGDFVDIGKAEVTFVIQPMS